MNFTKVLKCVIQIEGELQAVITWFSKEIRRMDILDYLFSANNFDDWPNDKSMEIS